MRKPEFLIHTGLVFPDGRALYFRLRKLPLTLFTLESCLDLGESGMLSVYLRIGPWGSSSKALLSVLLDVMISEDGNRGPSLGAEREETDLRKASGEDGVVSGRERGSERPSSCA